MSDAGAESSRGRSKSRSPAREQKRSHSPEEDLDERPTWNVHVANLGKDVTDQDLREAFASCGDIAAANVARDKATGASKGKRVVDISVSHRVVDSGFGFVNFLSKEAQEKCIKDFKEIKIKVDCCP